MPWRRINRDMHRRHRYYNREIRVVRLGKQWNVENKINEIKVNRNRSNLQNIHCMACYFTSCIMTDTGKRVNGYVNRIATQKQHTAHDDSHMTVCRRTNPMHHARYLIDVKIVPEKNNKTQKTLKTFNNKTLSLICSTSCLMPNAVGAK